MKTKTNLLEKALEKLAVKIQAATPRLQRVNEKYKKRQHALAEKHNRGSQILDLEKEAAILKITSTIRETEGFFIVSRLDYEALPTILQDDPDARLAEITRELNDLKGKETETETETETEETETAMVNEALNA